MSLISELEKITEVEQADRDRKRDEVIRRAHAGSIDAEELSVVLPELDLGIDGLKKGVELLERREKLLGELVDVDRLEAIIAEQEAVVKKATAARIKAAEKCRAIIDDADEKLTDARVRLGALDRTKELLFDTLTAAEKAELQLLDDGIGALAIRRDKLQAKLGVYTGTGLKQRITIARTTLRELAAQGANDTLPNSVRNELKDRHSVVQQTLAELQQKKEEDASKELVAIDAELQLRRDERDAHARALLGLS